VVRKTEKYKKKDNETILPSPSKVANGIGKVAKIGGLGRGIRLGNPWLQQDLFYHGLVASEPFVFALRLHRTLWAFRPNVNWGFFK